MLWGTLLLGSAVLDAAGEGVLVVGARLLPGRGASVWAWLNALTVPLALLVWVVIGALFVRSRRQA